MSGCILWVYPFSRRLHYFHSETIIHTAAANIHSQGILIPSGQFSPNFWTSCRSTFNLKEKQNSNNNTNLSEVLCKVRTTFTSAKTMPAPRFLYVCMQGDLNGLWSSLYTSVCVAPAVSTGITRLEPESPDD